ncbi:MAG: hypothetical protein ABIP51_03100 [Bacteroidia bacterium]
METYNIFNSDDDIERFISSKSDTLTTKIFDVHKGQSNVTIIISVDDIKKIAGTFSYYSFIQDKKERFYITGIKNLQKKTNFLQLYIQHCEKQINDEEYENELTKHPENYVIDIKEIEDVNDVVLLSKIIDKIDVNMTLDEASEMFSIDTRCIRKSFNQLAE